MSKQPKRQDEVLSIVFEDLFNILTDTSDEVLWPPKMNLQQKQILLEGVLDYFVRLGAFEKCAVLREQYGDVLNS